MTTVQVFVFKLLLYPTGFFRQVAQSTHFVLVNVIILNFNNVKMICSVVLRVKIICSVVFRVYKLFMTLIKILFLKVHYVVLGKKFESEEKNLH